jgi:gallate decarboxylase subunit D
MGDSHCLVITGGDRPHFGALAPSQAQPSRPFETERFHFPADSVGHKEDIVAHRAAGRLAAVLNCNVAVCRGIHVDAISAIELEFIDGR